jgi:hypothetical protein
MTMIGIMATYVWPGASSGRVGQPFVLLVVAFPGFASGGSFMTDVRRTRSP